MQGILRSVLGSFLIILVGFLVSRIGSAILIRIYRQKKHSAIDAPTSVRIYTYAIMTTSVILALIALRFDVYSLLVDTLLSQLHILISVILLMVLIILMVQFLFFILNQFIERSGLRILMQDYEKEGILNVAMGILRTIAYVFLSVLALRLLGMDVGGLLTTLRWVFIPLFILLLGLLFMALKNFVESLAYGIYIRSINLVRVGEAIKIRDMEGTIRKITYTGILLQKADGYSIFILHRQLFKNFVYFKKVQPHLDTLEKIKDHYIAQRPSYCGPASASVVLKIFGYDISQEKIGSKAGTEIGKGTHPRTLINIVQKLTDKKVRGVWVDVTKIHNLRQELKTWLIEGGFPIVDFKKSYLFPDSTKAHYSVCLAVRGDELLILDPNEQKGGIYFVDYRTVQRGMDTFSKLIGGKRGFIVFAPKGTSSYYRIEQGLAYSDADLYNQLNNKFRKELDKMVKKTALIEHVLPKPVQKLMDEYKKSEKVSRVWKPK